MQLKDVAKIVDAVFKAAFDTQLQTERGLMRNQAATMVETAKRTEEAKWAAERKQLEDKLNEKDNEQTAKALEAQEKSKEKGKEMQQKNKELQEKIKLKTKENKELQEKLDAQEEKKQQKASAKAVSIFSVREEAGEDDAAI